MPVMVGGKSFTMSVSSKVAVAAALGAGVVVGAGAAYLLTRIHEHTHLTQQISSLHATILEVKKDLATLETGLAQKTPETLIAELGKVHIARESHSRSSFRKKTVSFSSTTTSGSYKTARDYDTDSSRGTDTDYFSPDEDDDEFFDLSPEDGTEMVMYDDGTSSSSSGTESRRAGPISATENSDLDHFLQKVDVLLDGTGDDQIQALNLLKTIEDKYPERAEVLWRLAKGTRNMAAIKEKLGNNKDKERLIFEAYDLSLRALEQDSNSPDVHKWYAILAGARGEFLGIKERISSGNVFKKHIDRALELKPNDSTLHHLLGRFCYEVSRLSWIERKAAETLFGDVPNSSLEEAFNHFQSAEELRPSGWKENRLFLAKSLIEMGNYVSAVTWIDRASEVPVVTPDDEITQREVEELQVKYGAYRDL